MTISRDLTLAPPSPAAAPTAAGNHHLQPGTKLLDRYVVEGFLGEGGFAEVYRCVDPNVGRAVAIKRILPPQGKVGGDDVATRLERFRREARAAAAIKHACVVEIYDVQVDEASQQAYIVMELLDGHDLEKELEVNGPMAPERLLPLWHGCLEALGRAHEKGIVHKDLKPANLFLNDPHSRHETVKIVDFGVARVGLGVESKLTSTGQIFGTAMYLAPEYINHQLVTPALDVYQMGLILVELLTGRPVVNEESYLKCVVVHASGQFTLPAELMACPLGRVLERALAFDPNARFKDGYAFADALKAIDPHTVPTVIAGESVRTVAVSVGLDAGGAYMPTEPHTGPFAPGGLTTPMASGDHLSPFAVSVHTPSPSPSPPRNRVATTGEPSGPVVVSSSPAAPPPASALHMLSPPPVSQPIDTRSPRPAWLYPVLGAGAVLLLLLIGVPLGLGLTAGDESTAAPPPDAPHAPPEPVAADTPSRPPVEERTGPPGTASPVLVKLTTTPDGATVHDGDAELGQTPLQIAFEGKDADARELRLSHPGFMERTLTVRPTDADLDVDLVRPTPPPRAPGKSDKRTPTRPKAASAPPPTTPKPSTPPTVKPKPPTVILAD